MPIAWRELASSRRRTTLGAPDLTSSCACQRCLDDCLYGCMRTLVASSTVVSYSTKRTREWSTISPSRTVFQSRPWNLGSPGLVGGLFIRSWKACCDKDGCRDARGEPGPPRICSAKLPRCECGLGLGLDPIARPGGGERPSEAAELLRDCSGEGTRPSLLLLGVSNDSAIARTVRC